ncbi:MAG: bifunctional 3-demethylubiquinol 3-O-methyltransferase/2-polyprenyl-6-hydroxyphenol methylase [Kordiimonas sp.]|nr:bifunctional 3-demethylubiquinol 3-O-methyltransferase/2-polyprenyl-6-hydroxyphenol methylase [Kordiimonas sp.]
MKGSTSLPESVHHITENPAASSRTTTVDPEEIAHFSAMAATWWDPHGPFKPLHQLNPTRLDYIRDRLCQHFNRDPRAPKPLSGLRILDIGCGGGLLCEPLTRLGAQMVGADAAEKNIKIAAQHAQEMELSIDYRHITAEALAADGEKFDAILNTEVIEHVADINVFLSACFRLLRPDGAMIISTLNRTAKSYLMAIVGAEYVLRLLPRGTHHWQKFLKPSELSRALRHAGFNVDNLCGMVFSPLAGTWSLDATDLTVNYIGLCHKPLKNKSLQDNAVATSEHD